MVVLCSHMQKYKFPLKIIYYSQITAPFRKSELASSFGRQRASRESATQQALQEGFSINRKSWTSARTISHTLVLRCCII